MVVQFSCGKYCVSAAVTYVGQACCCLDVCMNRLYPVGGREAVDSLFNIMVLLLLVMQLFFYLCFVLCQPSSDNAFIIRAAMSYRTSLECKLQRLRFGLSPLWRKASPVSWMRIPFPAAFRVSIELDVAISSKGLLLHATGVHASMMITGNFLYNFLSFFRSRIRSIVIPIVRATFIESIASVIHTVLNYTATEEDDASSNQPLFKISAHRIDANSVTIDINHSITSASLYVFVKQLLTDWYCSLNDDCESTSNDDCVPFSRAEVMAEKESDNIVCPSVSGVTVRDAAAVSAMQVRVKRFRVRYREDARIYSVIVSTIRSQHVCTHCQSSQAISIDSPAHHHPMASVRHIQIQVAMPDREGFDFKLHATDLERMTRSDAAEQRLTGLYLYLQTHFE